MEELFHNKETDEFLVSRDGEYVPAELILNKDTGERKALVNGEYQDVAAQDMSWMEAVSSGGQNLGSDASKVAGDLHEALSHPINTAKSIFQLAKGVVQLAIPGEQSEERLATAVAKHFKDRYGGLNNVKRAVAYHPVETLMDLSMVVTGLGTAATKVPVLAKHGQKLAALGNALDPVTLAAKGVAVTGKNLGKAGAAILGISSGAGAMPYKVALKTGLEGGERAKAFTGAKNKFSDNVVRDAQDNLAAMAAKKTEEYQAALPSWEGSTTHLDIDSIIAEFNQKKEILSHNGASKVNPSELKHVNEIEGVLQEWIENPSRQTAGGFDALKSRLDSINIPVDPFSTANKRALSIRTALARSVKKKIVDEVPVYAEAMDKFKAAADLEKEIGKTLGLTKNATVDSTLRKLVTTMKNNQSTNFGERTKLLNTLDPSGILEAKLAGAALHPLEPSGIIGRGAAMTGGGMAAGAVGLAGATPWLGLGLLSHSPRVSGTAVHWAGKAASPAVKAVKASGLTPRLARNISRTGVYTERTKEDKQKADGEITLKKSPSKKKKDY